MFPSPSILPSLFPSLPFPPTYTYVHIFSLSLFEIMFGMLYPFSLTYVGYFLWMGIFLHDHCTIIKIMSIFEDAMTGALLSLACQVSENPLWDGIMFFILNSCEVCPLLVDVAKLWKGGLVISFKPLFLELHMMSALSHHPPDAVCLTGYRIHPLSPLLSLVMRLLQPYVPYLLTHRWWVSQ